MTTDFAKSHLALILGFFPRVESQITLLVGVEVAAIGFLASRLPKPQQWTGMKAWPAIFLACTFVGFAVSFIMLYRAAFPNLKGGQRSLVYFREIAGRTEAQFAEEYKRAGDSETVLLDDMIGQIWRNSEILKDKYDRLKWAYVCFAISIPAWAGAIAMFSG